MCVNYGGYKFLLLHSQFQWLQHLLLCTFAKTLLTSVPSKVSDLHWYTTCIDSVLYCLYFMSNNEPMHVSSMSRYACYFFACTSWEVKTESYKTWYYYVFLMFSKSCMRIVCVLSMCTCMPCTNTAAALHVCCCNKCMLLICYAGSSALRSTDPEQHAGYVPPPENWNLYTYM